MRRVARAQQLIATGIILALMLAIGGAIPFSTTDDNALAAGPQAPLAQIDFFWTPTTGSIAIPPGETKDYTATLRNNGVADTFDISFAGVPAGWNIQVFPGSDPFIPNNNQTGLTFRITVAPNTSLGNYDIQIIATRRSNGSRSSTVVTVTVSNPTVSPTQTPTQTPTLAPRPTATATPTPGPVCVNGADIFDPRDDTFETAVLINVDVEQRRGICSVGDQDWFRFGGIGGKVYTIDIPKMDAGLDLLVDLYDENGRRLAGNDDYFRRDPGNPAPKDIKPRIQSWRAPRDGMYFLHVRDVANIGGSNLTYSLIVLSESYGPTPITVPEICRDLFEEDGLPEEAKLITSNEIQWNRALCPTGDADWVRFFGKAGKTYALFTDTSGYKNSPELHPGTPTEAGADTVIYLADRDGVSILDFNDDIPGGNTLDSEIQFTPSVDGFYYAQVKNVGDIGNQFIRYDLVLKLCVPPSRSCGRGTGATPRPSPVPGETPSPDPGETPSPEPGQTTTPTRTPTGTPATFTQNHNKPGAIVNGPYDGFVDAAFERVWQRNDRPVAAQRATRSWAWGPSGVMARAEGYLQAPSGLRQVQYFDKARMEINNPTGIRDSKWFVTTGLLVVELVSGKVQLGEHDFVQRERAAIPIAGDQDDPNGPTYASFAAVVDQRAEDRTNQIVGETINREGKIGAYQGPPRPETQLVQFVGETGHNIPKVFWDYLNARGTVYEGSRYRNDVLVDWVFTLGFPISEPYWTRIRVAGVERDVLVQPFQRRVLTYTPDNAPGWQVEMGNVGRHYYLWRYGEELP